VMRLGWLRSRKARRRLLAAVVALAALPWVSYRLLDLAFPLPAEALASPQPSAEVLARDGSPLSAFTNADGMWQVPVRLSEVSPRFLAAAIAVEDHRFRSHGGVDALAILRAALQDLAARRIVSGASTITMQAVRLAMPRERSFGTKCVEAFRAWQLEEALPKDAILERYVNLSPFGGNLVGVEAASRAWFGKRATDLTLAEAALLAGLPQSPSRLRPDRHPEAARARRDCVLARMRECGVIDAREEAEAASEPVTLRPPARQLRAPHLCLEAIRRAGCGGTVRTTLDPAAQEAAEAAIAFQLPQAGVDGAAAVVVENATGAVVAYVGSPDYLDVARSGAVDGALAPRSPGSALKPVLYALAFEQGEAAPERLLSDAPLANAAWRPEDCDRETRGPVTAREALVRSLNLPAVRLLATVGVEAFRAELRGCGVRSLDGPDRWGLTLALGGGEVSLFELVEAASTLARLGVHRPLRRLSAEPEVAGERVLSETSCWLVADILRDRRMIEAEGIYVGEGTPPFALKTGTSSGHRDAWAIAYGPRYTVGVWMGNPDGRPHEGLFGASAAAPAAARIYAAVERTGAWYARPAGIVEREVCATSGLLPIAGRCAATRRALESEEETPRIACDLHAAKASSSRPRIVSPVSGSRYLLGEGAAAVALRATCEGASRLYWFVDGEPAGTSGPGEALLHDFDRGTHRVTCVVEAGGTASVEINAR